MCTHSFPKLLRTAPNFLLQGHPTSEWLWTPHHTAGPGLQTAWAPQDPCCEVNTPPSICGQHEPCLCHHAGSISPSHCHCHHIGSAIPILQVQILTLCWLDTGHRTPLGQPWVYLIVGHGCAEAKSPALISLATDPKSI